jgi:PAS domain S-box-containing protein
MYSFLFTGLLFSGIGLAIASRGPGFDDVFHYIVFGCLLFIILIDHKQYLTMPEVEEAPIKEKIAETITKPSPNKINLNSIKNFTIKYIINTPKAFFARITGIFSKIRKPEKERVKPIKIKDSKIKLDKITRDEERIKSETTTTMPRLLSLKDLDKIDVSDSNKIHTDIQEKTDRIISMKKEVDKTKAFLNKDEKKPLKQIHPDFHKDKTMEISNLQQMLYSKEVTLPKNIDEDYQKTFDEMSGYVAIIQSGLIKQVKNSFARFLGYEIYEIIDEKLTNFVTPESFYEIERYYISKLKGNEPSSYKVTLLKKDKSKVNVRVNTKPIYIDGKNAEIISFQIL